MIEQCMDGSQTLMLNGMVLELPTDTMWMLDNSQGEWMVVAAGRTPKSVAKLMKLKRVKTYLGSRMLLQWGSWSEV